MGVRLHDDELEIDAHLVRGLLRAQVPRLADLPLTRVASTGTVHALFRLGRGLVVRLPRVPRWSGDVEREAAWLPVLAAHLSLEVPRVVAVGRPTDAYPCPWLVLRWLDGSPWSSSPPDDERDAARRLAGLVVELRALDPAGAPGAGRRPLRQVDDETRAALRAAADLVDADRATEVWSDAVTGAPWQGTPVWVHADLLGPNLLVRDGRLAAVIDWGTCGVGDPASDLVPAWAVLGPAGRAELRAALDVDDATWVRARGIALAQAAAIVPYYRRSHPAFAATGVRTVEQVLADASA
ncbi:aminoglycoside phosphotransferase family protein [Cellulomonas massiliensis]|uniref:aminoglycoside phosphotransferase family protein n=1 Tax=Cellulomonas massiliensis TaxID=1465811 RepID=UPI0002E7A6F7|nr:aminoglycoside phosphotransferase family protein [Cellulomonas massiliensis]